MPLSLARVSPLTRTGSTHNVYRGWRFAVAMDQGHPDPGTTLFTVPIDPAQGVIAVGASAAFSWSTTSTGTADPFAVGLDEARRHLEADGWTQDATVPACYAKPHPTRGEDAELHGWETEGGMCG